MLLENRIPLHVLQKKEQAPAELIEIAIARAHFDLKTRQKTGWRGVRNEPDRPENWSMKVDGSNGVWALGVQKTELKDSWALGSYKLYYFPDPADPEIESMSVAAGLIAHEIDYTQLQRNFSSYADLVGHFCIGQIHVGVSEKLDSLVIGLRAKNLKKSLARDGIFRENSGIREYVVEPMGIDCHFPALKTAGAFFSVLHASFCNIFTEGTAGDFVLKRNGYADILESENTISIRADQDVKDYMLLSFFGNSSCDSFLKAGGFGDWEKTEAEPEHFADIYQRIRLRENPEKGERLPMVMVTGFLGSGKTTLVQNFLNEQLSRDRFVAVIQNEVGPKSIDTVLTGEETLVKEIDEGCICCTATSGLFKAVKAIKADYEPDLILLETSGLADPVNLLHELKDLEHLIDLKSVVTVLDAAAVFSENTAPEIFKNQVRYADVVMLNKWELADRREDIVAWVDKINPEAKMIPANFAKVNLTPLLDLGERSGRRDAKEHNHSTYEDYGFHTRTITTEKNFTLKEIQEFLDSLSADVYRVKGMIRVEGSIVVVQFVAGRYEFVALEQFNDQCFLVFIGKKETLEKIIF